MSAPIEELAAHQRAIGSLIPILEAMRSIAELAWRRAEQRAGPLGDYQRQLDALLPEVLADGDGGEQVRVSTGDGERGAVGLLLITSERGLCGAFNERLVAFGLNRADELACQGRIVRLLCLGSRGKHLLETRGHALAYFRALPSLTVPTYVDVEHTALDLLNLADEGLFTRLEVVAQVPVRRFQYERQTNVPLPPDLPARPRGRHRLLVRPANDVAALRTQVLTEHLLIDLFRVITNSAISEQLARVYTMRMGTDNAHRMLDTLALEYNSASKQAITNELLEILAGYAAIAGPDE